MSKPIKIFISHSMSGLSEEYVLKIRQEAIVKVKSILGDNVEIIENYYHENVPDDAGSIWHLGTSIREMEKADYIYFHGNWKFSKGCLVEKTICDLYKLNVLNDKLEDK